MVLVLMMMMDMPKGLVKFSRTIKYPCWCIFAFESRILVLPWILPGNLQSAVAHIITAVIGSGVLSLAWSTSQLGWIGGPVALLCCAIVTYISSFLLPDCYRTLDPVTGKRNYFYMDVVRVYLGSNTLNSFSCSSTIILAKHRYTLNELQ